MKTCPILLIFIFMLCGAQLHAQGDLEDVMYLKNGSIYRGTIVEQIPNVSFKIEIAGGSVILIHAADVTKITKEKKFVEEAIDNRYAMRVYEFHYRLRTWFIQAQGLAEAAEVGFRLIGGYKFHQFGILGLGTGLDLLMCDLHGNTNYAGFYVPVLVYYSGEILRRQTTPFYSVEAGYAFVPSSGNANEVGLSENYAIIGEHGGVMGGGGFGVRFYSRRRVHFDLSAHLDFKMSTVHFESQTYSPSTGNYTNSFYSTSEIVLIPGLRFGVGF